MRNICRGFRRDSPFEETQKVCYTGKNIPKKEFLCKRGKKHEKGIVCGFFFQREALLAEGKFDHPRFRYAHRFAAADKIVIAAPFWDLSFPALLKVYIENLCVDGITFHSDETGLHGLCKADHMVFLTARGGIYTDSPMEQGARYLEQMAKFFGIAKFDCVAAEGLDIGAWPVVELMEQAKEKAAEVAKAF